MSLSTSLLSYSDCMKFMDKALEYSEGARLKLSDESACIYFRMRCQQARQLDRESNQNIYDKDHFMHGRSQYDVLTFRIYNLEDAWFIYAERTDNTINESEIEGLGEAVAMKLEAPHRARDVEYTEIEAPKQITSRRF